MSAGTHQASFGHIATSPCQGKEALHRVRPAMGFGEWRHSGKFSINELKEQEDESMGSHTQHSPYESDTCASNSSSFESSSFSYKSEASLFVKGGFSPVNATETGMKLEKLYNASLETCVDAGLGAGSIGKWGAMEVLSQQHLAREEFMEFTFLDGYMIENPLYGRTTTAGSEDSQFEEEPLLEYDEEWSHGSATPAFYSASACSPETCSEASYHSSDTNNTSWINDEFMHCAITELKDWQQRSHADFWNTELQDNTSLSLLEESIEQCQHQEYENRVPQCPLRLPINDPDSQQTQFHDRVLNQHEEGLSFQPLIVWNAAKVNGYLSLTSSSNIKNDGEKGTVVHHCIDADFFVPSNTNFERGVSRRQGLDQPRCDTSIWALQPICHHFQKVTKAFPLSPLSFSKARQIERPDKPNRKKHTDIMLPGTSKSQPSILPFTKTHWNWRSKSLAARAIMRSAVQNFEHAFNRSRSMPLPKTHTQTPQNDLKTDNSSLLDRVLVSPLRNHHKHIENLKPLHRSTHPDCHFQQENKYKGRRAPLSQDAQSLALVQRSLSMDANLNRTSAPANPVASPLPLLCYDHRTDLDISRNLFYPSSQSIHPEVLDPANPVVSSPKLPNLQSDSAPPSMLHGYLQCLSRDGVPSYTLMIDDSEEMLLARACISENQSNKEDSKWVYTFHSQRSKAKGKRAGGWKSWKRKDKIVADLAGKMQVSSVLCPEVGPTGEIKHSLVSEFVLFDGRAEDAVRSQSLRFWSSDVAHQNGPTAAGSVRENAMPLSQISAPSLGLSKLQVPEKRLTESLIGASVTLQTADKQPQSSSPTKGIVGHRPSFSLDICSDTESIDRDIGSLSHCPSHMELAAIVIRVPATEHKNESKVSDCHSRHDALGWSRKFLDISSMSEAKSGVQALSRAFSLSAVNCENHVKYRTIPAAQVAGTEWFHTATRTYSTVSLFNQQSSRDTSAEMIFRNVMPREISRSRMAHSWDTSDKAEYVQHDMLQRAECVTIILPKGDHGLPNEESSGPSPLIERWRSGGKCNCGGWDLGCGITVLSTKSSSNSVTAKNNTVQSLSQNNPLNIFSQGSRQEVTLSLSVVQPGFFMLTFQEQLSPLRAFATSVAILHSKNPPAPREASIKTDNLKEKLPRAPAHLHRTKFKVEDKTASTFGNLRRPFNPPLSPIGRV